MADLPGRVGREAIERQEFRAAAGEKAMPAIGQLTTQHTADRGCIVLMEEGS